MRLLLISAILIAVIGCGYALHKDPELHLVDTPLAAYIQAEAKARSVNGSFHQNICCGSMEPIIKERDWLVVKSSPWGDHLLGKVCQYKAGWSNGDSVVHRFVSGSSQRGFVASGDNNGRSEPQWVVRANEYEGEVIAIYRVKK